MPRILGNPVAQEPLDLSASEPSTEPTNSVVWRVVSSSDPGWDSEVLGSQCQHCHFLCLSGLRKPSVK